ncbi:hypothetical protein CR513_42891, partial [Mucuna pruriens]
MLSKSETPSDNCPFSPPTSLSSRLTLSVICLISKLFASLSSSSLMQT